MAFFIDIVVVGLAMVSLLINADFIPFEELTDLLMPYVKYLYIGMGALLLIKYLVYIIRLVGDLRYEEPEIRHPYYLLMGAYPLMDFLRVLVVLGLLSAMIRGMAGDYIVVNAYVYYVILTSLVVMAIVMNYFCYHTQTLLRNVIPTAVLLVFTLALSRGLFLSGLGKFFAYTPGY
ncbi:MAG: hypothetical protein ACOX0K_06375 [Oscillospiraceae bacterium]